MIHTMCRKWLIPGCLLGIAAVAVADQSAETAALVVDAASGQLYGAVSESGWLSGSEAEELVSGARSFDLYTIEGVRSKGIRLSRVATSETCSNPAFRPTGGELSGRAATLVSAPWDAAPRIPAVLGTDNPRYRELVSEWLREQGIDDPEPTLAQLWRIDLEGDGRDEVLVAAARHRGSITSTDAGDYSVLLLRRLVDDEVITVPIRSELYPEMCIAECALAMHEAVGVLDLTGDGSLEIITRSSDYESVTQSIHTVDGTRVIKRLEWFCGA